MTSDGRSNLEAAFDTQWRILGGQDLEAQYRFGAILAGGPGKGLRSRLAEKGLSDWRFDRADPFSQVAIELDGGTWGTRNEDGDLVPGRHVRGDGYAKDCRKLNAAALAGWLVFRFTTDMIANDPAGNLEPVIGCIEVRRAQMAWLEAAVGSED